MKTSKEGIELIKKHEGLRLRAYDDLQPNVKDPNPVKGTMTIGYGHTGDHVKVGMEITEEQAENFLIKDLEWAEYAVNGLGLAKTQNEFDALVSWVFNTGASKLFSRSLIKSIQRLRDAEKDVEYWWNKYYITSKGVELPGLVKRRKEEAELFAKN